MEQIKRIFLGWDIPAVKAAALRLAKLPIAELASTLVIVPTHASSYKLRLQILEEAETDATLLPEILTTDALIKKSLVDLPHVATHSQELAAWASVLATIAPADFPYLFKENEKKLSFEKACSLSSYFIKTQSLLEEAGWGFDTLTDYLNPLKQTADRDLHVPSHEYQKWRELADLWRLVKQKLKAWKLYPPRRALEEAWKHCPRPAGKSTLILLCHPDPTPDLLPFLLSWENQGLDIQTWIHAPESLSSGFDKWGRPVTDYWLSRRINLPEGNHNLVIAEDAHATSKAALQFIAAEELSSNNVAVGICDPAFGQPLEKAFRSHGWRAYDSSGRTTHHSVWVRLISCLREVLAHPDKLKPVRELATLPLAHYGLGISSTYKLTVALDRIQADYLPQSLSFTLDLLPKELHKDLNLLVQWISSFTCGETCRILRELVDKISLTPEASLYGNTLLEQIRESLEDISLLESEGQLSSIEETLVLLERNFMMRRIYADSKGTHLDLENWLELGYSTQEYLLLIAMHEGIVPDNDDQDFLLPEKIRKHLGLRGTSYRAARDSYLFSSLLACRKESGKVRIFISRHNTEGLPVNPSSFLLRSAANELPSRVLALYPGSMPVSDHPHAQRGNWMLDSPGARSPWSDPEKCFSPSLLKDFLHCPLRFWLRHVTGFKKLELEASAQAHQMGSLIHKCLEELGNPEWSNNSDSQKVANMLQEAFSSEFKLRFGDALSLPLSVQYEFGLRRIKAAGRIHADYVREGWHTLETEKIISRWSWEGNYLMNMRLDCIQENEHGEVRILDYKTGKRPRTPAEAHLSRLNIQTARNLELYLPELPVLETNHYSRGNTIQSYRWTDLQLPLYKLWAAENFPGKKVSVAYFNIPLNLDGTGIYPWEELDTDTCESARKCAVAVMKLLREIVFSRLRSAEALGWPVYRGDSFSKMACGKLETAFGLMNTEAPLAVEERSSI